MADIIVAGNTSGSITISAPSVAGSTVLTLPVIATDTLAGIAATQTLTNKTLVAPALGTPASGVLTNCTGVVAGALPAGSVLQVVNATYSTEVTTTSASWVTTGLSASITPRSASNKVLVVFSSAAYQSGGFGNWTSVSPFRGTVAGTNLVSAGWGVGITSNGSLSGSVLDSPATTSPQTYTLGFFRSGAGTAVVQINGSTSTITLMEIAG